MGNAAFRGILATALVATLGGITLVLGFGKVGAATPKSVTCAQAEIPGNVVPVPTQIDATCAVIPKDMNGTGDTQPPVDLVSWLTFVAVNWPVDATTCTPASRQSILTAPPNPTWLTYRSSDDVFVAAPATPAPWCPPPQSSKLRASAAAHLPPPVQALALRYFRTHPTGKLLFLHHDAKGHDLAAALRLQARLGIQNRFAAVRASASPGPNILQEILDATDQPVVDQHGRFERFTISVNSDEYGYIIRNKLWRIAGEAATGNLNFPTWRTAGATVGAMEFKAGWKVLVPGKDIASHFFTMPAIVYNDQAGSAPPEYVTVGLVALHITHKTPRQPSWIWSTFEQIDNTNDGPADVDPKSFYNPACAPASCPPNVQTAPTPYIEVRSGGKRNPPTQVVAVVTPQPQTVQLNAHFRRMLGKTPWAYYQLISAQWVGGSGNAPPRPNPAHLGVVQPFLLGNPVMETYVPPSPTPSMSSIYSCIYCHSLFMQGYYKNFTSDFSLIVNAKQP